MSILIIILLCLVGYSLLSLALVPLFVYNEIDKHRQYDCTDIGRICQHNKHELGSAKRQGDTKAITSLERKCSASHVTGHSFILPIMLLGVLPRLLAFRVINKLEDKDEKIRKMEKQAEADRKVIEESNKVDRKRFDEAMEYLSAEANKKKLTQ